VPEQAVGWQKNVVQQVALHVLVYGGEDVVQQEHVSVHVQGAGQRYPCLLTATQGQATFAYLRFVSVWQLLQVWLQCASLNDRGITHRIKSTAEANVTSQRGVLNPGLLSTISD
jgi:hypothetical protein